ncbi:MAG: SCP2 sterol-binding domain-containing protein [Gammaproteobacteria bacterium]|nr:SCP2 sterol-binding domain-containing protein [Gammaproteobacteria bacterium]
MSLPDLLLAAIETTINRYLSLDPEAMSQFASLEGKVIAIDIKGINQSLYLYPAADGMMVMGDFDGEADTRLSGTPLALARLGLSENAAPVLFSGEVKIEGDSRLGHQFKRLLAEVNIDWEEHLSRYLGDVLAHQLGNAARNGTSWFNRSKQSLALDLGEYLQEESRMLVSKAELDRFVSRVDQLREAADRLDARVHKLFKQQ